MDKQKSVLELAAAFRNTLSNPSKLTVKSGYKTKGRELTEEEKQQRLQSIFESRQAPGIVHSKNDSPAFASFKPKNAYEDNLKKKIEDGFDPVQGEYFRTHQDKKEYWAPHGGVPERVSMKEHRTEMERNSANIQRQQEQSKRDAFEAAVDQACHALEVSRPQGEASDVAALIRETNARGGGVRVNPLKR